MVNLILFLNENVNTEMQRCYIDISRVSVIAQNKQPKSCILTDEMQRDIIFNRVTFTGVNTGGLIRFIMIYKPFNVTMTNTDFINAVWQPGSYGILTGYADNIAECT